MLVAARIRRLRKLRLWTPIATAVGILALLITPTVWSIDTMGNGSNSIPTAGPTAQGDNGFGGPGGGFPGGQLGYGPRLGGATLNQTPAAPGSGRPPTGTAIGQPPAGAGFDQAPIGSGFGRPSGNPAGAGVGGAGVDRQLLSYLEKHQGSAKYLFATSNSNSAAPYIIQSGKPVMALGGFTGSDPILTLAQFQALVKNHSVRYVLGGGGMGGGGGQGNGDSIMQWVQTACSAVPAGAWQGTTTPASSNATTNAAGRVDGTSRLYFCSGA